MKILYIHDGKSGHKSALFGVMNNLKKQQVKEYIYQIDNSIKNYLPYFFTEKIKSNKLDVLVQSFLKDKDIKAIIAIGKRTLNTALYFKKKLNIKLVYLMPPSKNLKHIDLSFYHSYKTMPINNVLVPVDLPPHNFVAEPCIIKNNVTKTSNKILSVLVGGDAKNINFNKNSADKLFDCINKIIKKEHYDVWISTSRRTNPEIEKYLKLLFNNLPSCNFFGYHENNKNIISNNNYNPYNQMLSCANDVIVTTESTSMIAEAVSLKETVGVYIFADSSFNATRYKKLHDFILNKGYAFNVQDFFTTKTRVSYNATSQISNKIFLFLSN